MPRRLILWKEKMHALRQEIYALYLAYRDPRTPWYAKVIAACVVGYAFSPIDLIPDFIPVLGYLDDLVIVPLGAALALRLIPPSVMADCRLRAATELAAGKPTNWIAAGAIILFWLALIGACAIAVLHLVSRT
jgi:uncharacterized membrane protein YkvA (DUF1232 family)